MNTLLYRLCIIFLASAWTMAVSSTDFAEAQIRSPDSKHTPEWVILGRPGRYVAGGLGGNLNRSELVALVGEPAKAGSREADMFKVIVSSLKGQSGLNQMALVNRFYNQQPYKTDDENYGVPDHWATVGEFLSNGGDCEDYAIAKYRTLIRAGFPESQLRIVLVDDTIRKSTHAVLAARVGQVTYILDNQAAWLRPETSLTYYHPIYSLNGSGVWYHGDDVPHVPARQVIVTDR